MNHENSARNEQIPVPPILEPGFPVYPGPGQIPVPPILEPGFPVYPGPGQILVPPILEPGFPVYPGPGQIPVPPILEPGFPVYPGPGGLCRVRVLNAALGSGKLEVLINRTVIASSIGYGELTHYSEVADGFRTVSVFSAQAPRQLYLRRTLPFRAGDVITLAVLETSSGLSLMQISDIPCRNLAPGLACLRMANLITDSLPVDMKLVDGRPVFTGVGFKEVTSFKTVKPGNYDFYFSPTPIMPLADIETEDATFVEEPPVLASLTLGIGSSAVYTCYLLGRWDSMEPILVVTTEDAHF